MVAITGNQLQGGGSSFGVQGSGGSVQNTIPVQSAASGQLLQPTVGHDINQTPVGGPSGGYVDPYAQWGGTNAYNSLLKGFTDQKNNIYGSANDAASALQGGYGQTVQDTIHNLQSGQQVIDRSGVQNEASRIQGGRDIMSMVGRGIQSGGVTLANKNAGSSSAAQAIANAYAQLGQRQMTSVGNQYASNAGDIAIKQGEQDYQASQAPNKFHIDLMNNVNNIVSQARDKFAALDAAMANASLPDRLAIDQEKTNVRTSVLGMLQQYDTQLQQGVGGIHAADKGTNVSNANTQLAAGQADPNLFSYQTEAPAQFQGTGPFASSLPLFTGNGKKQTQGF